MLQSIDAYIADHELSWAPSTLKSERHRLYSVASFLDGDAQKLWKGIESLKPYSRLTTWTRVCSFWSWLKPNEVNPYETFRKKNARLFKHVYQPKEVKVTFEEAFKLISSISNNDDRRLALQMLSSGERYSEAIQHDTSKVVGKGSKQRNVFRIGNEGLGSGRSYSSFSRTLKSVGLKAHDLRKLCATRLVEAGMSEADLLKVMGWSSILTAKAYLQPKKDEEIKKIFSVIHNELK